MKKEDLGKAKSNPVDPGKSKTYKMDHKIIWDKDNDKALVVAERDKSGDMVVKTSDKELQKKLEEMGYKANEKTNLIHSPNNTKKQDVKSNSKKKK